MKKRNVMKSISTALVVLALCAGSPGVVNAASVEDATFQEAEGVSVETQAGTQVAAPKATTIKLKSSVLSGSATTSWTFSFPKVPDGYRLYINVYEGSTPKNTLNGSWYTDSNNKSYFSSWNSVGAGSTEYTIYASDNFTPGTKKVTAYLYDEAGYSGNTNYSLSTADFYSPSSNKLSIKVSGTADVETAVKSDSIIMNFSSNSSNPTGYEVYRKVGSKYIKIAKVAKSTYTDTGLTAKTEYAYKVRPYYYNTKTKKTTYGSYTQFKRTTAGSALKLNIALSGSKNVKLSWSKVAGAAKYEVYRANGASVSDTVSKGKGNSFNSYSLIASPSKGKTSYTDSKTSVGETYSYKVYAVMNGNKKVLVEESKSITIEFGSPIQTARYYNAAGAQTVEWNKVYGADGYLLEQYNSNTRQWTKVRKLSKNTTKLTLAAPTPKKTESGWTTPYTEYRIIATKGSARSSSYISLYKSKSTLGVVSNVTAKKVSKGIKVSWSKVKGAAYYRVYRVKASARVKNSTINGYFTDSSFANGDYLYGGTQVIEYVGVVTPQTYADKKHYYQNYSYTRDTFTTTSMVDYAGPICYDYATKSQFQTVGPQSGVTYQYYVVAYAADKNGTYTNSSYNTKTHTWGSVKLPSFDYSYSQTLGCKKLGEATFTATKTPAKATIKSVTSSKKKQAVINIKKTKNATSYRIYRSTKKNGAYVCIGTTTKTKYTDTGLTSGKTYYYKVVGVAANEAGGDVNGATSAVKSVKVK